MRIRVVPPNATLLSLRQPAAVPPLPPTHTSEVLWMLCGLGTRGSRWTKTRQGSREREQSKRCRRVGGARAACAFDCLRYGTYRDVYRGYARYRVSLFPSIEPQRHSVLAAAQLLRDVPSRPSDAMQR